MKSLIKGKSIAAEEAAEVLPTLFFFFWGGGFNTRSMGQNDDAVSLQKLFSLHSISSYLSFSLYCQKKILIEANCQYGLIMMDSGEDQSRQPD